MSDISIKTINHSKILSMQFLSLTVVTVSILVFFIAVLSPTKTYATEASGWFTWYAQDFGLTGACAPGETRIDVQAMDYNTETPIIVDDITLKVFDNTALIPADKLHFSKLA